MNLHCVYNTERDDFPNNSVTHDYDVITIIITIQDELEFRHKALPISVEIDLYSGEKRKIEVSAQGVDDYYILTCRAY